MQANSYRKSGFATNYIVLHKSFLNRDFKKKKNQKEK